MEMMRVLKMVDVVKNIRASVAAILLSSAALASASQTVHPYSYNFTLDPSQTTIQFNVKVSENGEVKDSDSSTVAGSGQLSADLYQTGSWLQDFSQITMSSFNLTANSNPTASLEWWSLPLHYEANMLINNFSFADAGQIGSSPIDSSGNFLIQGYPLLTGGTFEYEYTVNSVLGGSGSVNLGSPDASEPNLIDIRGSAIKSNSSVTLSLDQKIIGSVDLSEFIDGYSMTYEIIAHSVTLPEIIQTPIMGDANFDGLVDISDLGILASNYGQSDKGWADGDFNFDGSVDVSDLGVLARNYGISPVSAQSSQSVQSIPEPVTLGFIVMAGIFSVIRRRK